MAFNQTHSLLKFKDITKYFLSRMGILPILEIARFFPACSQWLRDGSSGCAPPPLKRIVISAYLQRFKHRFFVETGTHQGDTLALVAQDQRIQCTSIELSPFYAQKARARFRSYSNVEILEGDSGLLMPQVVKKLKEPALFWLDGHYSAGDTAKGSSNTPIIQELEAVLNSTIHGHVLLIDDIRLFNGTLGYPYLDTMLRNVRETSRFQIEISMDIARLTPHIDKLF